MLPSGDVHVYLRIGIRFHYHICCEFKAPRTTVELDLILDTVLRVNFL